MVTIDIYDPKRLKLPCVFKKTFSSPSALCVGFQDLWCRFKDQLEPGHQASDCSGGRKP